MSITLENHLKKSSYTTKSAQFHTGPKGANHQLCVTYEYREVNAFEEHCTDYFLFQIVI